MTGATSTVDVTFGGVDAAVVVIRAGFLGVAVVLAVVCTVDWLVRTRRVSPFGPVARLMRSAVDPLIRPIERRVVRAGGLPSNAPWWALAFVVLAGILLISLIDFLRGQAAFLLLAVESGPKGLYRLFVSWTFAVLQVAIIVRVILSWVSARPGAWYARWAFAISEPILRPLRRIIPAIGMIDITPIVAWFALGLLRDVLMSLP